MKKRNRGNKGITKKTCLELPNDKAIAFHNIKTKTKSEISLTNCISERPEQICFITRWFALLPLFAEELSQASCSRGTGSIVGLETLYTADRIILFLQLVLRCQCDSCLYEYASTYRISLQTDCLAELWWCYILIVPKYKKKNKNKKGKEKYFLHFLGIVQD